VFDVADYWDRRYLQGRTSGAGSEGAFAREKAEQVRRVIEEHQVTSIIDWGAGDGHVLGLLAPQVPYLGLDVSRVAVARLRIRFPQHKFALAQNYAGDRADLALSLDVIFHQVSDVDYQTYMHRLFGSAERLVLIHSTNHEGGKTGRHVRWRNWTPDVERWFPDWRLAERTVSLAAGMSGHGPHDDPSRLGFYLYTRG
jgi:hypothetical protein